MDCPSLQFARNAWNSIVVIKTDIWQKDNISSTWTWHSDEYKFSISKDNAKKIGKVLMFYVYKAFNSLIQNFAW